MSEAVLEIDNLTKVYEPTPRWMRIFVRSMTNDPIVALQGVSLELAVGSVCAVVGPNGAGKSTLFRVLTGLTTPTSGSVRVLGLDPLRQGHVLRSTIGFMPSDDRTLFLRHSAEDNLVFHGKLQNIPSAELGPRIDATLELVGLEDVRRVAGFALSSGMRSRLMLARALLHRPQLLILDEPTGTIDPIAAHDFIETIATIARKEGMSALVSSHRLEEIDSLRRQVVVLSKGQVAFTGDLDDVEMPDIQRYEIISSSIDGSRRIADAVTRAKGSVQLLAGQKLEVTIPPTADLATVLHPVAGDVVASALQRPPLRDVISSLTTGGR